MTAVNAGSCGIGAGRLALAVLPELAVNGAPKVIAKYKTSYPGITAQLLHA